MNARPKPPWELSGPGNTRLDTAVREEFRKCLAIEFMGVLEVRCAIVTGRETLAWDYSFIRHFTLQAAADVAKSPFTLMFLFDEKTLASGQPRLWMAPRESSVSMGCRVSDAVCALCGVVIKPCRHLSGPSVIYDPPPDTFMLSFDATPADPSGISESSPPDSVKEQNGSGTEDTP